MNVPPASLLALAGIGFIGAFGLWKMGVQAYTARRARVVQRTPA